MAEVLLHNIEKKFGDNIVIRSLDLEISDQEFVVHRHGHECLWCVTRDLYQCPDLSAVVLVVVTQISCVDGTQEVRSGA